MNLVTHLDADAFFASVEQAADPRLRGRPVAVGGEKRGIIASASYEARKFGVYTPMPTVRARRLCPKLVVLPGDFEKYERFSRWMFSYAYDFTPDVEVTSIDEGYFDLTLVPRDPVVVAQTIRRAIREALKITVSEGIGSNKLVSQIASKLHKPAAFEVVPAGGEIPFLHPLPNHWLPGVGPKTAGRLTAAGLARIGQVAATPVGLLELLVGSAAPVLRRLANGIDERPIIPVRDPAKSYSQQATFAQDQTDEEFLEATLRRMADELMAKVRADAKAVRTLTVKVRYNDMAEDQCSESLAEPTDLETDLYGRLHTMLRNAWKRRVSLRLVSLKLSNLYEGVFRQELALDREAQNSEARRRLARAVDELRRERGRRVILRGHDFVLRDRQRREERGERREKTENPGGRSEERRTELGARSSGIPRKAGAQSSGSQVPSCQAPSPRYHPISYLLSPISPVPAPPLRTPHSALRTSTAVPLLVRSYYSFLNSTLSPEAVVEWAKRHDLPAVALCDQGNLHGAAAFAQAAQTAGIRPIFGAEVRLEGKPLWLYVENARGYANLCRILSVVCLPSSALGDVEGLVAVGSDPSWARYFLGRFYLGTSSVEAWRRLDPGGRLPGVAVSPVHYAGPQDRWKFDIVQSIRTLTLLRQAHPEKRMAGEFHFLSAAEWRERFRDRPELLERTREIAERCAGFTFPFGPPQFPAFAPPDGSTAREFLRRLVFEGARQRYGKAEGGRQRTENRDQRSRVRGQEGPLGSSLLPPLSSLPSPGAVGRVWAQIEQELQIIHEVGYEEYFLVVWDILQECRKRGIDWITRGSAADSLVCYCLGISGVCPIRFDLYFRRFLNPERMALQKLPDIDVDFPHDRKDDVVDLIFEKYGEKHCAVVGGFSTFQVRSAFAEVAKVLGVAEREVRRFTEHFPWSFGGGGWEPAKAEGGGQRAEGRGQRTEDRGQRTEDRGQRSEVRVSALSSLPSPLSTVVSPHSEGRLISLLRASPECRDLPLDEEPYRSALGMAEFLDGFPRYPKMHPCGVVLSRQPMHELTPTFVSGKGYSTTQLDMDAVEAIGLIKIDVLAQGGLAVMREVEGMLREQGVVIDRERCEVRGRREEREEGRKGVENGRQRTEIRGQESGVRSQGFCSLLATLSSLPSPEPNSRTSDLDLPTPHYDDSAVWEMIASGGARAVHHIESPAMISLCRMTNVREIDGLIAIVSVIRPGAANEQKKLKFTRRYQGWEAPEYPHPALEACLRSTYGLVVYEEHILQICEAFAGLNPGRADVLRRALFKQKWPVVEEIGREFLAAARARGHDGSKIREVWELVTGFNGYAFCKAHSTAYGVEAYQAAWLKRYFPAEFMAAVLTNGKGFYSPLVYVLECQRLGIRLLPPWVNEPGPQYTVQRPEVRGQRSEAERPASRAPSSEPRAPSSAHCLPPSQLPSAIRVPVSRIQGLGERLLDRLVRERERGAFGSLADFYRRVAPAPEEMELLIRAGALDGFGQLRTAQFWEAQILHRRFGQETSGQGWLFESAECGVRSAESEGESTADARAVTLHSPLATPHLTEPSRRERLQAEMELLGFTASGHPLELYEDIAWETYCPVARLGEHVGEEVATCGLVIQDRVHHQENGEPMKFLTLCDRTGMVETELFAATYKAYGLATVRYPVLEVVARVEPFENGRGYTLRVQRAGKPRTRRRL